ncbi:MAG: M28 family peptidase [Pseudomonadota bacterium]
MNKTETALLADARLDDAWALVESFSRFKREHPDDVNKGMDEVVSRLRAYGVDVKVHRPDLFLSLPGAARVEAGAQRFKAKPPAFSVGAPGGLNGKLVYVGANQADNIDTIFEKKLDPTHDLYKKIAGNIVISEGFASPGMIAQFEDLGAIGVVGINPGTDIHWGICTTIWGMPDLDDLPRKPGVVAVAVNRPDGDKLIEIAKNGGSITLFTEMEEGWYSSQLPEVFIPGSEEPEKYVLLHGHLDSWDVGVGDNATGDATLLECARLFWHHKDKLRRSIRIAWWPGHSTGRYAGSTWFADRFAIDLEENCVAQVNCDSPGCRWASEFINLSAMTETHRLVADVIEEVAGKTALCERPHRAGDYSFNNIGISSFFMLSSTMPTALREEKGYYAVGGCGANIAWHTENDTLEIADRDNLLRDIKIYALAAWRTANAGVLPFDWRATLGEFRGSLETYRQKAGDRFDFTPSIDALDGLDAALAAFYTAIASDAISRSKANAVIHALARILVPVNFTRETRFRHDPALSVPPLPSIALAADLDHTPASQIGFARNQLTRGQNRLVSALNHGKREVLRALSA